MTTISHLSVAASKDDESRKMVTLFCPVLTETRISLVTSALPVYKVTAVTLLSSSAEIWILFTWAVKVGGGWVLAVSGSVIYAEKSSKG